MNIETTLGIICIVLGSIGVAMWIIWDNMPDKIKNSAVDRVVSEIEGDKKSIDKNK